MQNYYPFEAEPYYKVIKFCIGQSYYHKTIIVAIATYVSFKLECNANWWAFSLTNIRLESFDYN